MEPRVLVGLRLALALQCCHFHSRRLFLLHFVFVSAWKSRIVESSKTQKAAWFSLQPLGLTFIVFGLSLLAPASSPLWSREDKREPSEICTSEKWEFRASNTWLMSTLGWSPNFSLAKSVLRRRRTGGIGKNEKWRPQEKRTPFFCPSLPHFPWPSPRNLLHILAFILSVVPSPIGRSVKGHPDKHAWNVIIQFGAASTGGDFSRATVRFSLFYYYY